MKTITNSDYDKLELLYKTKSYTALTEEEKQWVNQLLSESEYTDMRFLHQSLQASNEADNMLTPNPEIKKTLDKALAARKPKIRLFEIQMPMYQSVAIALLLFFIGFWTKQTTKQENNIAQQPVTVIKYLPKIIVKEVKIPVAIVAQQDNTKPAQLPKETNIELDASHETTTNTEQMNPFFARQQEIAIGNMQRVMEENSGTSIGSDTVVQKMLVASSTNGLIN